MKKWLSLSLAVWLLLAAQSRVAAADCTVQHTVRAGENLFRIGLRYGVGWPAIAAANNLANPNLIYIGQVLCIPGAATATSTPTPASGTPSATATATTTPPTATATLLPTATPLPTLRPGTIPTFRITAVARDKTVTIQAFDFPAAQQFDVTMGPMGTRGLNGTRVGAQDSGTGFFTATYNIPANLFGARQLSIRLQSASGYYSYNWFYNNTTTP